jgi:hypothetical protein
MAEIAQCLVCGNMRPVFDQCPHCGTTEAPSLVVDTIEINLKQGQPLVEDALENLTHHLRRSIDLGIKAIVLIHGYGSRGEGGQIKRAVHLALESNRYSDRVDEYYFGEQVPYGSTAYQLLVKRRPGLKAHLQQFKVGNPGITILLLSSYGRSA